ncbi:MAG: glutamate ligase domain-containing protein [Candidatus Limnocylindrales bacterium]
MTRSAEEIGRGLAAARDARPIPPGERIHVVGAAGAGASAALLLAARAGAQASGCDPGAPSPYTAAAEAGGLVVVPAHDPAHVVREGRPLVDRLAVTKALTAVAPDHPELVAARELGIPTEPWQQVVADVAAGRGARLVGVTGTHGKSTSAGWLLHVLVAAGRDPSGSLGALLPRATLGGAPATARWGGGPDFVVEADEYAGNFDPFRPAVAALLDAEWDHPDVFADEAAVLAVFEGWIRAMQVGADGAEPVLVANVGDAGAAVIAGRLRDWAGRVVTVRLEGGHAAPAASVVGRLKTAAGGRDHLRVTGLSGGPLEATLALPGRHNAANALVVAATADVLGVPVGAIAEGLATFPGVGRRLELKGEARGVVVIDDYGHHPTAIAASIAALRGHYPGRRLWAVYEPLTYHRTAAMMEAFAAALAAADRVAIADIWAGRDPDTSIASAGELAHATTALGTPAIAPGTVEATADRLAREVREGDVVLVMGGGRSYVIAERLMALLGG